jgi:hypothetical protein
MGNGNVPYSVPVGWAVPESLERSSFPNGPQDTLLAAAQKLATGIIKATAITLGDEPLVCDLIPPLSGQYWTVYSLSAIGVFTVSPPSAGIGDQLVTLGIVDLSQNIETEAQAASTTVGWNQQSRGIPINFQLRVATIGGTPGYPFQLVALLPQPLTIPQGYRARLSIASNPASTPPGPGAGSHVELSALIDIGGAQR